MRNLSLLLMIGLVVLSACGVREQPLTGEVTPTPVASATSAPPGPSAAPAPDRTSGAVPIATPETTTTALPMITSQVVLPAKPLEPGTMLLRDAWAQSGLPGVVAQTLLYSFMDYNAPQDNSAFYRLTLGGAPIKEEIVRIPNSGIQEPTYGYLSPDGQYIAYLVDAGENQANLRMMRVDGSENTFITGNVFTVGSEIRCSTYVQWSPDSTRIAFHRSNREEGDPQIGQAIDVFDVTTKQSPATVAKYRWIKLIGWIDNLNISFLANNGPTLPVRLENVDAKTGKAYIINSEFTTGDVYCNKLSPDRKYAVVRLANGNLLLDIISGQTSATEIDTLASIWSPNGQSLLEWTPKASAEARIAPAAQLTSAQSITFFPKDIADVLTFLDTSPDGRYIVVCDGRWSETEGVINRFLLFDSQQNSWYVIDQGRYCPSIIGWLTSTDTITR